jgi:hypothetical protein
MAIVRGRLSSDGWTAVPHHWTRDTALSWKAKGLLAYIAGHAAGYELTVAQIIEDGDDGKDSVQAGLMELERAGYLARIRRRNDDGTWGSYDYELTERPDQSGSNQGGKIRTGGDQGKDDVSAGGDQSGFTAPENPPAKKTTSKKTREEHSAPTERRETPDEKQPSEINAGSILGDWIDYCAAKGITLTGQVKARYGAKIKELLGQGFEPKIIKRGLARMLERGKAAMPGLLDQFVVEVQDKAAPPPQDRPAAQRYQSGAEKADTRRAAEEEIARIGDQLAAEQGVSATDIAANLLISQQARAIYEARSTTCVPTGYSRPNVPDIIDVEWTEHANRREVTAS